MMSQEEFMDLVRLLDEGLTFKEIGERLGYHPATIAKWHREGGPPARKVVPDEQRVLDARWRERIDELLRAKPRLLATSVFDILQAEHFGELAGLVVPLDHRPCRQLEAVRII